MRQESNGCVSTHQWRLSARDKQVMPKKLVTRIMLSPEKLTHFRQLGWVGRQVFAEDLWHLNRRSVALAFLNGIFWACMPMPFQMVAAAVCAILIRCNVPLSLGLVFLTNPVTMPPYFTGAYQLGAYVLGAEMISWPDEFSFAWIGEQFNLVWWPLLTGSLIIGVSASAIGYLVIRVWWSLQIRKNWSDRKKRMLTVFPKPRDAALGNDRPESPPGDRG